MLCMKENNLGRKYSSQSKNSQNHQQECTCVQRHMQYYLHNVMVLLSHGNTPPQYTYIEGPDPLYISYINPEQTK